MVKTVKIKQGEITDYSGECNLLWRHWKEIKLKCWLITSRCPRLHRSWSAALISEKQLLWRMFLLPEDSALEFTSEVWIMAHLQNGLLFLTSKQRWSKWTKLLQNHIIIIAEGLWIHVKLYIQNGRKIIFFCNFISLFISPPSKSWVSQFLEAS